MHSSLRISHSCVVLEVVLEESECCVLFAVLSDGDRGAALDLAGVALLVVFAVTEPFAKFVSLVNLDERGVVGLGESLRSKRA